MAIPTKEIAILVRVSSPHTERRSSADIVYDSSPAATAAMDWFRAPSAEASPFQPTTVAGEGGITGALKDLRDHGTCGKGRESESRPDYFLIVGINFCIALLR
jgi:hypothetical protein